MHLSCTQIEPVMTWQVLYTKCETSVSQLLDLDAALGNSWQADDWITSRRKYRGLKAVLCSYTLKSTEETSMIDN